MSFHIEGVGTSVPAYSIDQQDAAEMAKLFCGHSPARQRLLPMLYRRTEVRRRHSVVLEPAKKEAVGAPTAASSRAVPRGRDSQGDEVDSRSDLPSNQPLACYRSLQAVTQSFYEPVHSDEDCGPTTAQRMQLYERCAAALACEASQSALENAAIPAGRVTHLVTISCTGFAAPGVDLQIIEQLGLPAEVARTHVGFMGCHGAMNGLRVARAFAESDPQACVLLCAVELCSLHQQYGWHPERIVANALFADGSAAVVGKGCPAEAPLPWRLVSSGSTILPHSADLMSWRIGDHGFEMTLSPRVPEVIRGELCDWLQQWLSQAGLQIGNICSWVIHPGGPRILKACAETLGLSDAQLRPSQEVLAEFGNMSSPTVLFILKRLMQADASRPCVMLAFGPGLTIEAALLL